MISNNIRDIIVNDTKDFCDNVMKANPYQALSIISSSKYLCSQASYYLSVMKEFGIDANKNKILEIGAGYGFFMVFAIKQFGWDLYGIEPSKDEFSGRFELARSILEENGIDKE